MLGMVELETIDKFGRSSQRVGDKPFRKSACKQTLDVISLWYLKGKVCTTILELYNESAIVAEPAGALAIAALDFTRRNKR